MGGTWEIMGYLLRTLSIHQPDNKTLYILENMLILLAPLWINAFDYIVLSRMVHFFLPGEKIAGLRPQRLATCFVCLDIVAFIVQLYGALLISKGGNDTPRGFNIFTGGTILQQCFIACFFCLVLNFHMRVRKHKGVESPTHWARLLFTLYISLALITTRVVFRIVEYSSGADSKLPTQEVWMYVLDALPISAAMSVMNISHPGSVLVGPDSQWDKKKGKKRNHSNSKSNNGPSSGTDRTIEMA
jgi:hypothetical protein